MQPVQTRPLISRRRARAIGLVGLLATSLLSISTANATDEEPRAIFVMQRDGTNVRNLVSLNDFKWLGNPRWSHDGKRLAFDGKSNAKPRLFTLGADGKNLLDLGEGAMPSWSPDDKQLAFHVFAGTGPLAETAAGVWVQNVDGKGRARLVEGHAPRWSPDGSQIVLAGTSLRIFDMIETKSRDVFAGREKIDSAVGFDWSPDGKRLAAIIMRNGGRELVIVSADASDKQVTTRLRGNLHGVAWSPRESLLATSIQDEKTGRQQLYLLSADGNDPAKLIDGQEGDNREPSWSPDGTQLAFASSRKTGQSPSVTAAPSECKLELVRSHDKGGTLYSLAFTPDGRSVLLGGDLTNRRLQVWDPNSGEVVRNIDVRAIFVAVSPDGLRAACAEVPGSAVQYIDLKEGTVIREFAHGSQVLSMEFSGDGTRLISGGLDQTACLFNVDTGAELARLKHDMNIGMVAFSPDGKLVATVCADKKLHLWETATGNKVREIEHAAVPYCVAFSPDGSQLLTGTGGELIGPVQGLAITPIEDNSLRLWDVESGKLIREMKGHTHVVFSVAFSPDGKRAVSGSFDHSVRLWDVERGEELSSIEGKGWVTKVLFSSDGNLVLAAGGAEKPFNTRRWTEYPDERVRLFKVVKEGPTPKK